MSDNGNAPGSPGIEPRWTSSAKSGVGTAVSDQSRIWFTLSHGILNEVYYPRIDLANTRDAGFLVSDGKGFFSEEKRHARHEVEMIAPGVPGFNLTNTCQQGHYRIHKTILADPARDVLLQKVRFQALQKTLDDYHLYILLAPHIRNAGSDNNGWVGDYKGLPMLFAERQNTFLALACSTYFAAMSCGYVGYSDGWQDIKHNGVMTRFYQTAKDGNIALTGEIDLKSSRGEFVLALAFSGTEAEAGQRARAALLTHIISPDALALVRFGLRAADDPHITNTVKAIDHLLKTETSTGPVWHRYTLDGYGEHEDGSAFDGTGVGRGWPLLTGERAHYELACGHHKEAEQLLKVMEAQCSTGGLIPEQIWDADDLTELELFNGQPSGSAMPLVWAHAEYVKLLRSIRDGQLFDTPPQTVQRYISQQHEANFVVWRWNIKRHWMPHDKGLRIEVQAPAKIIWTTDNWASKNESITVDSSLGLYYFDLPQHEFTNAEQVEFTFFWIQPEQWENTNYVVQVIDNDTE